MERAGTRTVSGVLEVRKDQTGFLRQPENELLATASDPVVPGQLVRSKRLQTGSWVVGQAVTGGAPRLTKIETVDGLPVAGTARRKAFKRLTVVDPDFHYELGTFEQEGQVSMRVVDLLAPLGRGQRMLLVAPPRSGKTVLMQQIASAIEGLYPDVYLVVLLIDERPEEATYWRRAVKNGKVFVSTLDQSPQHHVKVAEMVQAHCERMVESGHEVVMLLDSITRLARAHNHVAGSGGKTMSGGLDSRAMAKPKQFFGAARNTEDAGSLTIVGTTLVDTGSRLDQVIFEEFKGTGNAEIVLDRRLSDRRIYPAISVEKSGTRKEERLVSQSRLRKLSVLRRVLGRMRPLEAMELLVNRLERFSNNDEFLDAFTVDDSE